MTRPRALITIPQVLDRFRAYHAKWPEWGALHVALEDSNTEDGTLLWTIKRAQENGDHEGAYLAKILLVMSRTQRRHIVERA